MAGIVNTLDRTRLVRLLALELELQEWNSTTATATALGISPGRVRQLCRAWRQGKDGLPSVRTQAGHLVPTWAIHDRLAGRPSPSWWDVTEPPLIPDPWKVLADITIGNPNRPPLDTDAPAGGLELFVLDKFEILGGPA